MAEDKTPVDRTGMANPGDDFDRVETIDLQVEMCLMLIEWCKVEKRTYLRNRIEIKLSQLYLI